MNDKNLKLLYRSLDEKLTPAEQKQIEEALRNSKALQEERERLLNLREMISGNARRYFKPFFAERVMHKIRDVPAGENNQELFFESLISVFRPIAVGAVILLLAIVSFNIVKSEKISLASVLAAPEVTLEEAIDPAISIALELEK